MSFNNNHNLIKTQAQNVFEKIYTNNALFLKKLKILKKRIKKTRLGLAQ
jgi:hypothetical protein